MLAVDRQKRGAQLRQTHAGVALGLPAHHDLHFGVGFVHAQLVESVLQVGHVNLVLVEAHEECEGVHQVEVGAGCQTDALIFEDVVLADNFAQHLCVGLTLCVRKLSQRLRRGHLATFDE